MEKENISSLNFKASELVLDALKNAELVLFYSTEVGKDICEKDVETITDAKKNIIQNNWDREIEIRFWVSYKNLTKLIKPVTVDSLKASQETVIKTPNFFQRFFKITRRQTLAFKTVRFYTAFAVITMVLMLLLHIYFSIGTIRLNRIQAANEQSLAIEEQLDEIEVISDNLNLSAQQKQDKLLNQLYEVNTEKESNIKLLHEWVTFIDDFFFFSKNNNNNNDFNAIDNEFVTDVEPSPPGFPIAPEQTLSTNIEIIQQSQNYVLVIGLYILPLFYGLLGALTFVLRDLSKQTIRMKYTKESNITHILRLILGTIAGLAVGVFWGDIKQQESFIIVRSMGPLIVAYLSGLTVEYVFSAIEKWIGSILERALSSKKD
ncbi:MAG: hypothetical protein JXR68_09625 [Bacteroidales bacterium]|nr:hypothetical protein [Bacteroidales bacterium]